MRKHASSIKRRPAQDTVTLGLSRRPAKRPKKELTSELPRALPAAELKLSDVNELGAEADRFGFDAQGYLVNGFSVLATEMLSASEREEALEIAGRLGMKEAGGTNGEFLSLRDAASMDKLKLFGLLGRYVPLLHRLFKGGIKLPFSDKSPYSHHNQIQVAVKMPGFKGYRSMRRMYRASSGHIDQPDGGKKPGKQLCNFSALLGIVLGGDTASRDDAGNLFVAPGTHTKFAEAFRKLDHPPRWHPPVVDHYGCSKAPMVAVRARPGQAFLVHHQVVHGVAPNNSSKDRVHVYFRITASDRPKGSIRSYPAAMLDPTLETPLLSRLVVNQQLRIASKRRRKQRGGGNRRLPKRKGR